MIDYLVRELTSLGLAPRRRSFAEAEFAHSFSWIVDATIAGVRPDLLVVAVPLEAAAAAPADALAQAPADAPAGGLGLALALAFAPQHGPCRGPATGFGAVSVSRRRARRFRPGLPAG